MILRYASFLLVGLVLLWGSDAVVSIGSAIWQSMHIAARTVPFQTETRSRNMLVVGDSTAYGLGAHRPEESTAGQVGIALNLGVENRARSGALTREVFHQLQLAREKRYDLILIQVGANDVMKFSSLEEAGKELNTALIRAEELSDRVVLLTAGDIGSAPLWPILLSGIYTERTKELREIFIRIAGEHEVAYVDLFSLPDPFTSDIERYFTPDTLHPSSDGYAVWGGYILETIRERWPELYARH